MMRERESLFFVFTTSPDVATWPPFGQYDPKDKATLGEIELIVNKRIDEQVERWVPKNRRFYFRPAKQGLYLMPADANPSWKDVKGIIVDLGPVNDSSPERITTLTEALTKLAEEALPYARLRPRVLSCFIPPSASLPGIVVRLQAIRLRSPKNSKELEDAIAVWLADLSFDAMRDGTSEDVELNQMVNAYVESCLVKSAKARSSR